MLGKRENDFLTFTSSSCPREISGGLGPSRISGLCRSDVMLCWHQSPQAAPLCFFLFAVGASFL